MSDSTLIVFAIILRVSASFRDGWSARRVKWLPWHIVGWIYRDLIITWITWHLLGAPWESFNRFSDWVIVAAVNLILHRIFYYLGIMTIRCFPQK